MDRWQRISGIIQAARAKHAAEREAYVAAACSGDEDLRRDVEQLLGTPGSSAGGPSTTLRAGERFAHYVILDQIGAGGMGEVHRARDEKLDREVAVKVLPAASFDDAAARARLLREARAAAALNHPNVCTVYEVGEANGLPYIAMELIEGQTLSDRVDAGPLAPDELLPYARQLVDALTHAHDRGVIHRDLKSNNVIVTRDGRIKVLDFGLAKRSAESELSATATHMPFSVTQPGEAVGTVPYMAPEQLRGEVATIATDIWALGVVLYELAAGTRPFAGQTPFQLSAAILNEPAAPLPDRVPLSVAAVIERCLAKAPADRFASAAGVWRALEDPQQVGEESQSAVRTAPVRTRVAGIPTAAAGRLGRFTRRHVLQFGGVVAILAIAAAAWQMWVSPGEGRTLAVLPFENLADDEDTAYLCEGIADSLIEQTSNLESVRVTSLSTVLGLLRGAVPPVEAGRQLGVDTVLSGSLARDGLQLRISAQLLDVATGRQLWSNEYDVNESQLLNVQDRIATEMMTDGLRVQLTADEQSRLVRHPTRNPAAYDLYLQARYRQRRATEEDYLYSRDLLERATLFDPEFALAYAALAGTHAMLVTDGLERPAIGWPQVTRYTRQALAIDPELPEAHAFDHAYEFLFNWDWEAAAAARERLLQFPIGEFDPHVLRAMALEHWALGRSQAALDLARRTRELDPLSPYLAILEADYLLRAGQLDSAIALYEHCTKLDPANPNAFFGLAEALYRQRRFDEALAARRRAHEVAGDEGLAAVLATARGEEGYREVDRAWVRLQLDALKAREAIAYVSPLDFARAYAQLGEKEQAFKYLDAAYKDRSPGMVFLKVDPVWAALRADPKFQDFVRRMQFP